MNPHVMGQERPVDELIQDYAALPESIRTYFGEQFQSAEVYQRERMSERAVEEEHMWFNARPSHERRNALDTIVAGLHALWKKTPGMTAKHVAAAREFAQYRLMLPYFSAVNEDKIDNQTMFSLFVRLPAHIQDVLAQHLDAAEWYYDHSLQEDIIEDEKGTIFSIAPPQWRWAEFEQLKRETYKLCQSVEDWRFTHQFIRLRLRL